MESGKQVGGEGNDVAEMGEAQTIPPWKRLVVLVIIVVGAGGLAAWIDALRPPRLTVECGVRADAPPATGYSAKDYDDPASAFLLMDQIIITGPTSAVTDVVHSPAITLPSGVALTDVLTPTRFCDLRYENSRNLDLEVSPFSAEELSDLTMRVYQLEKGQSVAEIIGLINDAGRDLSVFADPNYLTGPVAGASACANPRNEGGGSPFEDISSTSTTAEWFWRQWAFEHVGAGPSLQEAYLGTPMKPTGTDVLIGVFDTSPYEPSEEESEEDEPPVDGSAVEDPDPTHETIPWLDATQEPGTEWEIHVSHPDMPVILPIDDEAADISDHGLFVSSLIHAVAPDSRIRLSRVLNEYGCGDLFTLNKALYLFIRDMELERETLDGTVINLSLSVFKPIMDDAESAGSATEDTPPQTDEITIDPSLTVIVSDTVESLQAAVLLAHSRGAVVVAAAGNDSGFWDEPQSPAGNDSGIWDKLLAPQIPARYPYVLGVAGTNVDRERACFSNWGDVSAPSGDSASEERPGYCDVPVECAGSEDGSADCEPDDFAQCFGDCDEAVISVALSASAAGTLAGDEDDVRYAYWRGTSFSAPLVSGLAALVLENGVASGCIDKLISGWISPWMPPNQVIEAIRCGTSTGDGVINMPATLFRCMP